MFLEVEVPADMVGPVLGDLQSRGGIILGMNAEDSVTRVEAECAMEKLFGYSSDLRSQTQGRGTFTLRFSRLDRA
jgi:elongation factor G